MPKPVDAVKEVIEPLPKEVIKVAAKEVPIVIDDEVEIEIEIEQAEIEDEAENFKEESKSDEIITPKSILTTLEGSGGGSDDIVFAEESEDLIPLLNAAGEISESVAAASSDTREEKEIVAEFAAAEAEAVDGSGDSPVQIGITFENEFMADEIETVANVPK